MTVVTAPAPLPVKRNLIAFRPVEEVKNFYKSYPLKQRGELINTLLLKGIEAYSDDDDNRQATLQFVKEVQETLTEQEDHMQQMASQIIFLTTIVTKLVDRHGLPQDGADLSGCGNFSYAQEPT